MDKINVESLRVRYSDGTESLQGITIRIEENAITALIGPAGGGKSTFLRAINRLNDLADGVLVEGRLLINGQNVLDPNTDVIDLRRRVGIVFSRPAALPMTIRGNIAYGLEIAGMHRGAQIDRVVEYALHQAELWDEVYDRLDEPAFALSGGQQQRLCIARALALKPEILLLDEPTSALDPISTARIESALQELKRTITIVIAPHNTQQAGRVADRVAFFLQGELVEYGTTEDIYTNPRDQRTQDYIQGRFG